MGFNIQNFRNNTLTAYLRPSKFDVSIQIPPGFQGQQLGNFMLNTGSTLQYYCTSAHLPAMNLMVGAHKHFGHGPIYKRPHSQPTFEDTTLIFNNDSYGLIWTFFNQWLNVINPFNLTSAVSTNAIGNVGSSGIGLTQAGPIYPWEISYLYDYCTVMTITQYMNTGAPGISVQLNDCYPIAMSRVKLDWGGGDSVSTFAVTMFQRDWVQIPTISQQAMGVPISTGQVSVGGMGTTTGSTSTDFTASSGGGAIPDSGIPGVANGL